MRVKDRTNHRITNEILQLMYERDFTFKKPHKIKIHYCGINIDHLETRLYMKSERVKRNILKTKSVMLEKIMSDFGK